MRTQERRPSLNYFVLETTRRCNLRCIHCWVSEENNLGNYDERDLPIELFRKLLPMLRRFKPTVQLSGHGETFLHPNFMEMLEEVVRAGCKATFQTNGTILTPRTVERFVRTGVENIVISIDGVSGEVFDKIRRRTSLNKIVDNIRLINETKKRLNTEWPHLGIEFVAMRQNIQELPATIKLAGELGAVIFQVAQLAEYNMTRGQSLANDPLMAEWTPRAEAEARKWGINLRLPPNIPGRQEADPVFGAAAIDPSNPASYKGLRKACTEPWERIFVQYNGDVRPCCVIGESYGNLSTQSFEQIWDGPKYRSLRQSLLSDEPFAVCVRCPLYGWERVEADESLAAADAAPGVHAAGLRESAVTDSGGAKTDRAVLPPQPATFTGAFRRGWKRFLRKLAGRADGDVRLSEQQVLWLLGRLGCKDPRTEFDQILAEERTLSESCLALLENGESLPATAFVERLYRRLLGREPDEQGFQDYVEALGKDRISRLQTVSLFLTSMELKRILVARSLDPSATVNQDLDS